MRTAPLSRTGLWPLGFHRNQIDVADTKSFWLVESNYDPKKQLTGMTFAKQRYYQRLNVAHGTTVYRGGDHCSKGTGHGRPGGDRHGRQSDYVNIGEVANVRVLPLGTDNFGRDVLTELVKATGVSLLIGLVAGLIATLIGLTLGLLAGYIGGVVDDIIMFFTNLFTVIPTFVLLILISFSIGQDKRGPRHHRGGDRVYLLGMDGQVRAGAGDFSAQSRPRQPVETIRALDRFTSSSTIFCLISLRMSSWRLSCRSPRLSWQRPACRSLGWDPERPKCPRWG